MSGFKKKRRRESAAAPNDPSFRAGYVCCMLVLSTWATECFSVLLSLFALHPMSWVVSLCSRCEWLVAVRCREWPRFLHGLTGWLLGGVKWKADIRAQGTRGLVLHMRPCWKGRGASEVTRLNSRFLFFSSHFITEFLSLQTHLPCSQKAYAHNRLHINAVLSSPFFSLP